MRIVLGEERVVRGLVRKPGFVLLQGVTPKDVTKADLHKALGAGETRVEGTS